MKSDYKRLMCVSLWLLVAASESFSQKANPDWMRHVKFGVMVHYLSFLQNGTPPLNMGQTTSWDSCVNTFDVNLFASQLHDAGAGYLIFTLYQGPRYICTPNEQFEKMTGYARGEATSHRDLILDLSNALQKYNIKFILYVTTDGTFRDQRANEVFQSPMLKWKENGNNFIANATWVNNWVAVLKEWSLRYGKRVDGWWVDGSYANHGFTETFLGKFYSALKVGNPKSIICFNNAVHPKIEYYTKWDTYTAGEMNEFKDLPPIGGKIKGKQWHILSFLGTDWFSPAIKYTPSYMIQYLNQVKSSGGVATINVAVYRNGSIAPQQLSFLKEIGKQILSN